MPHSPEALQISNNELFTASPVPELNPELLEKFTLDVLHPQAVGEFDPQGALETLKRCEGKEVFAIDIGGDKIAATRFTVRSEGLLEPRTEIRSPRSKDGQGYLSVLEAVSYEANGDEVPVGMSFAGVVETDKPAAAPNVEVLMEELKAYGGKFTQAKDDNEGKEDILFGDYLKALDNDAVAGLRAGAVEAMRQYPGTKNVIYLIVGSGLGGAVLKDGQIISTEPGHVPVVEELNPYARTEACGVFGRETTCIEKVASGKAGIEATWYEQTGEAISAYEIEKLAKAGNIMAQKIYDNSAAIVANAVQGLASALNLNLGAGDTSVVFHGGVFKFSEFGERIQQILDKAGSTAPIVYTKDFSENACLDGAAIAALTAA